MRQFCSFHQNVAQILLKLLSTYLGAEDREFEPQLVQRFHLRNPMPDVLNWKHKTIVLMMVLQQASKFKKFENSLQINHMCYSFGTFTLKCAFPWHGWLLPETLILGLVSLWSHTSTVTNYLSEAEDGPRSQKSWVRASATSDTLPPQFRKNISQKLWLVRSQRSSDVQVQVHSKRQCSL